MNKELIEGVNIGSLPDPFPYLNNDKIRKIKSSGDLNEEYRAMYEQMEKSLSRIKEIKVNEVVTGTIKSINQKEILIDFGFKDFIYVDKPKSNSIVAELVTGDNIDVLITSVSEKPFMIKGSITELIKQNVHNKMKSYYEDKISLIAEVISIIPAGYNMSILMDNVKIDAFMPNTLADVNKLIDTESILGVTFEVMLETLQQEKGVYVVSRRKYLQSLIPEEIKKLKNDIIYEGYITGTTPFGIFVQFKATNDGPDCLTGMVHKANIGEKWQEKWDSIKPGMTIEFYVKEVIKGNKIILTQILKESLWDSIKVGKIMTGKIRDIKNFGALISLDDETTGLIQTSYINKYDKNIKIGDEVKVKVISLIKDDRKIYLNFA